MGTRCSPRPCARVPCVSGESLEYGYCNFDNIGLACLNILTVISLEGWTAVMYQVAHTWGFTPLVNLYFIAVVLFGSFFMLNLALAVIWAEYAKADEVLGTQVCTDSGPALDHSLPRGTAQHATSHCH